MGLPVRSRSMVVLALMLIGAGCRETDAGASKTVAGPPPVASIHVTDEATGLSFRYLDPTTQRATTVLKRADVPEAARRFVMVYDERLPPGTLAAGEMVVADLTEARPDGTYPARVVSTVGTEVHEATAPGRPDAALSPQATAAVKGQVLLFVTSWCPHCKRAEGWFKERGLPFTKLDVEREAGARELLLKLFRDNQVPEEYASSVPVIAIGGKVLLGFDEAEVEKALRGVPR